MPHTKTRSTRERSIQFIWVKYHRLPPCWEGQTRRSWAIDICIRRGCWHQAVAELLLYNTHPWETSYTNTMNYWKFKIWKQDYHIIANGVRVPCPLIYIYIHHLSIRDAISNSGLRLHVFHFTVHTCEKLNETITILNILGPRQNDPGNHSCRELKSPPECTFPVNCGAWFSGHRGHPYHLRWLLPTEHQMNYVDWLKNIPSARCFTLYQYLSYNIKF